ncbi:MAG: hypothetical protein MK160_15070, partial [Rhodobacteraceae bacterium]|nr:hypothetical protein [Paracoccaceae bacterium]
SDAVLRIVKNPLFAQSLSEGARASFEERLTWTRWAERFMVIAEELVVQSKKQHRRIAPPIAV